jgi:hypothetical protein
MNKLQKINILAKIHGYGEVKPSTRKSKKYMTEVDGKLIHFGAAGYEDWHDHQDIKRRRNYKARHSSIRLKDGRLAYKVFGTPSHLSYNILW